MRNSGWATFRLTIAAGCGIALAQPPTAPPGSEVQVRPGEKYGVIAVSIRAGYLWPAAATVEAGVYRIQVDDPSHLAPGAEAAIDDDAGKRLQSKPVEPKGHRTSLRLRLVPGKHKIKIGANPNWVLQVTVEPPK